MAYLSGRPGRFDYVHTPKHGSWRNLSVCYILSATKCNIKSISLFREMHLVLQLNFCLKYLEV